jgi:hypothetical protein
LERLSWKNKIAILHKTVGKSPVWGKDPLQFANEVFSLRDKLAHGKSERVVGPKFRTHAEAAQYKTVQSCTPICSPSGTGKLQWYRKITKDWVMEAKERFRSPNDLPRWDVQSSRVGPLAQVHWRLIYRR